jgi:predicted negative regulator of RcsB-dependent stress response
VLFLVFVLLISAGLFAYNKYIQNEVEKLQKDLAAERQIIGELEARKDIQVYSLLKNNERVISELEKRSKVSTYIKHLKSLSPENVY